MGKVKLTILSSRCRSGYHRAGEIYDVSDLCPPICHELWHRLYPYVMVLLNEGALERGASRERSFEVCCPDGGLVVVKGETVDC